MTDLVRLFLLELERLIFCHCEGAKRPRQSHHDIEIASLALAMTKNENTHNDKLICHCEGAERPRQSHHDIEIASYLPAGRR
jgi:hypothetical protein